MGAQIALREIAAAARDLADLRQTACAEFQASAHGVTIALRSHQLERYKVISIATTVVKQQRGIVVVGNHQIDKAIVIKVPKAHAPCGMRSIESVAGGSGHVHEFSVTIVMKQRVDLFVANFGRDLLHFRVHVAIGDEEIEPAIVVVIEESATKA